MELKNTGLNWELHQKHKEDSRNYKFGAVTNKIVIEPTGQYLDFAPMAEMQSGSQGDKMDCVSESSTNVQKVLFERLFNVKDRHSVRFLAKMSGTTRNGNSLYSVALTARNKGFAFEMDWPRNCDMTWDEYYAEIPNDVISKAADNISNYELNYEMVATDPKSLMAALQYGPLQVIGYAWQQQQNGLYNDFGNQPNHAFVLAGYSQNGSVNVINGISMWVPDYWIAYDSYPANFDENDTNPADYIKHLAGDFHFGDAMLYSIRLKSEKKNLFLTLFNNAMNELRAYMDNHGLHIWYVDQRGAQEIPLTTMFEKALAMEYVKSGIIKTSSYGAIAALPAFKFF